MDDLHLHGCPECHEYEQCSDACDIEPDFGTVNSVPFASYATCDRCIEASSYEGRAVWRLLTAVTLTSVAQAAAERERRDVVAYLDGERDEESYRMGIEAAAGRVRDLLADTRASRGSGRMSEAELLGRIAALEDVLRVLDARP